MVQITPQQIFTTRWKNPYPHQNFLPHPSPHWDGRFLPYPLNAIWKTLVRFAFPSQGVEIISHISQFDCELQLGLTLKVWHLSFFIKIAFGHRKWVFNIHVEILNLNFKEWEYSQDCSLKWVLITLLSKIVCELLLCFS